MGISNLPEVMLFQLCLKAEKAFHCAKNSVHMFHVHVQHQPSLLLHAGVGTHNEQST